MSTAQNVQDGARPSLTRRAYAALKGPVVLIALVLATRTVLAQPFYVPSGSMEPTLQIGDELIATKFAYGYSRYSVPFNIGPTTQGRLFERLPKYGDVIVFALPRDPNEVYVKRAVGLPGDRVQMRQGRLWINDKELPLRRDGMGTVEDDEGNTAPAPRFVETLPNGVTHPIFKMPGGSSLDDTPVFVVPPEHVFAMGDNRDNSLDSRVPAWEGGVGFVPVANLIGRADIVLGSWDFPIKRRPIWEWPSGLRLSRFFSLIR
jgi:signal peptidase I